MNGPARVLGPKSFGRQLRLYKFSLLKGVFSRISWRCVSVSIALLSLVLAGSSRAAEVSVIEVEHHAGVYRVRFAVDLQADPTEVRKVVLRYGSLKDLSPIITESELLTTDPKDTPRLKIVLRPCLWIFCKTVTKVSEIDIDSDGAILFHAIPELSSLLYARETVRVAPARSGGARFFYDAIIKVKHSLIPVIGPVIVKRKISKELMITAKNVEQIAGGHGQDRSQIASPRVGNEP